MFRIGRRGSVLRGVAYERDGWYVAVCLDHYLVTQARSEQELPSAILSMLQTHLVACKELGREPFDGLGRAPDRYWRMYEELSPARSLHPEPPEDLLPRYPRLDFRVPPGLLGAAQRANA